MIAANHNDIGIDGIAPEAALSCHVRHSTVPDCFYPGGLTCAPTSGRQPWVDVHSSTKMDPWVLEPDRTPGAALRAAERCTRLIEVDSVIAGAGDRGIDIDHPTTDSDCRPDSTPIPESLRVRGADGSGAGQRRRDRQLGHGGLERCGRRWCAQAVEHGASVDFAAPGSG